MQMFDQVSEDSFRRLESKSRQEGSLDATTTQYKLAVSLTLHLPFFAYFPFFPIFSPANDIFLHLFSHLKTHQATLLFHKIIYPSISHQTPNSHFYSSQKHENIQKRGSQSISYRNDLQIYNHFSMNKALIATLVLLGVASVYLYSLENQTSQVYSFEQFKGDYSKRYSKEGEEQYRKNIFLRNLIKIQEHNSNPSNTYTMGVNQFTDLTQAEFEAIYLTLQVPKRTYKTVETETAPSNEDVDWVKNGKVTPVKNQGSCGSCWAFSATAAHESAILIDDGRTVSLSEQQLVDCSRGQGNQGCNGGWMDSAFDYVIAKGLTTTEKYPYVARDQACKIDGGEHKITDYVDVPGCNELANALSARPVSVAVDASVWSAYRSGVLSNCAKNVNHGVLLVGATEGYWHVKNSWGATWGEAGFIRLGRGDTCAICQYPSYPKVK